MNRCPIAVQNSGTCGSASNTRPAALRGCATGFASSVGSRSPCRRPVVERCAVPPSAEPSGSGRRLRNGAARAGWSLARRKRGHVETAKPRFNGGERGGGDQNKGVSVGDARQSSSRMALASSFVPRNALAGRESPLAMGSVWPNSRQSTTAKAVSAPSVVSRGRDGARSVIISTSITTTQQDASGVSSAAIATPPLGASETIQPDSARRLTISNGPYPLRTRAA